MFLAAARSLADLAKLAPAGGASPIEDDEVSGEKDQTYKEVLELGDEASLESEVEPLSNRPRSDSLRSISLPISSTSRPSLHSNPSMESLQSIASSASTDSLVASLQENLTHRLAPFFSQKLADRSVRLQVDLVQDEEKRTLAKGMVVSTTDGSFSQTVVVPAPPDLSPTASVRIRTELVPEALDASTDDDLTRSDEVLLLITGEDVPRVISDIDDTWCVACPLISLPSANEG